MREFSSQFLDNQLEIGKYYLLDWILDWTGLWILDWTLDSGLDSGLDSNAGKVL